MKAGEKLEDWIVDKSKKDDQANWDPRDSQVSLPSLLLRSAPLTSYCHSQIAEITKATYPDPFGRDP